MLQLQRASAGSGKTYALAKTYIRLLISIVGSDGKRRLRSESELLDSAAHILAITFTNKATAEMKSRIIRRLADLANADGMRKVDYLDDFMEEFGASREEINHVCAIALNALLNDYSDFQVSTIDSFFQTVLRTFAFEVDINDSYEVEIDSEMLAIGGIDMTLRNLTDGKADGHIQYWLDQLTDEAMGKNMYWNLFDSGTTRRNSLRTSLLNLVKQMNKEEFKLARDQFDDYFNKYDNYKLTIEAYRKKIEEPLQTILQNLNEAAQRLRDSFTAAGLDIATAGCGNLAGQCKAAAEASDIFSPPTNKYASNRDKIAANPAKAFSSKLKKGTVGSRDMETIAAAANDMFQTWDAWIETLKNEQVMLWRIYRPTILFPLILHYIRRNLTDFLADNNLVELGDTNSILSQIIGDDDAPFIYERLGTRLNHFLIDEFQDTSAMQWRNLRPLIAESLSYDNSNLIIGDAKQSIYRFRNADPSLITSKVPADLRFYPLVETGNGTAENANHRSLPGIVNFNNYIFSLAVRQADKANEIAGIDTSRPEMSLTSLYSNVVQYPCKEDNSAFKGMGYTQINFIPKKKNSPTDFSEDNESDNFSYVGPLIDKLIDRGYCMKDIAVLVLRNDQGRAVINHLINHNRRPGASRKINFVSDESLRISLSRAVGIIVNTLEIIALASLHEFNRYSSRYADAKPDDSGKEASASGKPAKKRPRGEMTAALSAFVARHPEYNPDEAIRAFLEGDEAQNELNEMISSMHSVTLPALAEAITSRFVPEELQIADAPFIAAFQDALLDYCRSYPADLASFLEWWDSRKDRLTINSPQGLDAVNIMTIHKSKGLEFKCVILPDFNLNLGKTESSAGSASYLWIEPKLNIDGLETLPPVLPVKFDFTKMVANDAHREQALDFLYADSMDCLNRAYVAFTRAVDELYIFTNLDANLKKALEEHKLMENSDRSLTHILFHAFHPDGDTSSISTPEIDEMRRRLRVAESKDDEGILTIDIGNPVADPAGMRRAEELKKQKEDASQIPTEEVAAKGYCPNSLTSLLQYKSQPHSFDKEDLSDETSDDPRRRGNILHDILSEVKIAADLPGAVKRRVISGQLTAKGGETALKDLSEALTREEVAKWFDPSLKIIAERFILINGAEFRPDRVSVTADGKRAIVVDYKFGSVSDRTYRKKHAGYVEQVCNYCRLVKKALKIPEVEGWLWYVTRGTTEKVF